MRKINKILLYVMFAVPAAVFARENAGKRSVASAQSSLAEACGPARSFAVLDINNVRTTIQGGGDMWWDLVGAPKYEVPKGSGKHSLFAGALWIGGLDDGNQLRVAAMTYRQNGNDFWPGPLDMNTVATSKEVCDKYDHLDKYKITRKEVADFKDGGALTLAIQDWPGNSEINAEPYLAPFVDVNADGIYSPEQDRDYPAYAFTEADAESRNQVYGDQTIWWVFNDKGNIHTETGAAPIGVEIQAQAFAFTTNDEINNMTFYSYKIINRSSNRIHDTYFGQWVDPDLGDYADDYVGCDVGRGLGYVYNGDNADAGSGGYGSNPPALGVDFFEGPIADGGDGVDNDRDCSIDELGEQIVMSKFVYYNNDYSLIGNPEIGPHFYNYLQGKFKDGTKMCYGKNGWQPSNTTSGIPCDFMFPGDSDPQGWGLGGNCAVKVAAPAGFENWSEAQAQNTPADRRFLQSAGKFTLEPGAVNYITVGVVWGQASSGGAIASVNLIRGIDDKAQALFDNKFRLVDGPSAPDLTCQEMDRELLFYINNGTSSNNFKEAYAQIDPTIKTPVGQSSRYDSTYRFQGYMVYQIVDPTVGLTDILIEQNKDKAKLVFQCDIKDGVAELINFTSDPELGGAGVGRVMVKQAEGYPIDAGVKHSFRITEDKFATGSSRLVNHKTYYYLAVAYAYNNYKDYKQDVPSNGDPLTPASDGQKMPFLAGRLNIKSIRVMPHIPSVENGGTIAKSYFGEGVPVTRIKGTGNGGNYLKLSVEEREKILNDTDTIINEVTYEGGSSPIEVKVIDPLNVSAGKYKVKFLPSTSGTTQSLTGAKWALLNEANDTMVVSDRSIEVNYEQLIPELGISIRVNQVNMVGAATPFVESDFIGANMEFNDLSKKWLTAMPDIDGCWPFNWIRSGIQGNSDNSPAPCPNQEDINGMDNNQVYENVLGGTWAPGIVTAGHATFGYYDGMPIPNGGLAFTTMDAKKTQSVDVVITDDKTKWSRCPVFEMGSSNILNENGGYQYQLRRRKSVDKEGNSSTSDVISTDPSDPNYISAYGFGWFPGYAVCVETGERLNIGFGEDSYQTGENGNDMLWNPTSTSFIAPDNYKLGGKHYIYVFGSSSIANNNTTTIGAYDAGKAIFDNIGYVDNTYTISGTGTLPKKKLGTVYRAASWVNIPLLAEGHVLHETDVTIELRVPKSFEAFPATTDWPEYQFSTNDLATLKNSPSAAKAALALTNVVPNPYYAFSSYEGTYGTSSDVTVLGQVDNRVRITYLPKKCTISIYTPNGNLIRRYTKDDDQTYLDWDIKNNAGIICASGVYLIHVEAPGIGEKVIKWFGVMRPLDLDQF